MKCTTIRELISADLDCQATDEQMVQAFKHLAECRGCRNWRSSILEMQNVFDTIESQPVPDSVHGRLRRSAESAKPADQMRSSKTYSLPRPLVWAAAAIIVLQLGWSSHRFISSPSEVESSSPRMDPSTITLTARDRTSAATTTRMPPTVAEPDSRQENREGLN
jgi:hypothetical protein